MNTVLVKIFALALALSQVMTDPDGVKTQFDPARDQATVAALLRTGCAHLKKVFNVEDINVDDLVATAMADPEALSGRIKPLHGLTFDALFGAYRQFCTDGSASGPAIDMAEVIGFYNRALGDLPDVAKLKTMKLTGVTVIEDAKGNRFAELGEPDHRRIWVPFSDIPQGLARAFVAAEDRRFFEHKGIDERGLIRAFINNLAQPGRPEGGSTITQQVVKNLLVGNDVTYERKIREIILSSRLEHALSKPEILALYLNCIYLGRGAWGVGMAARSYFGKSVKDLTLREQALLAGLAKGPAFFSPDRHPERARERVEYVLNRMQEDGAITAQQLKEAQEQPPQLIAAERTRRDSGFYFLDFVNHEAKTAGLELSANAYTVHSTINSDLQRATEGALQEGLARYELRTGRAQFKGAELNLGEAIQGIEKQRNQQTKLAGQPSRPAAPPPAWQQALEATRLPLYDVHWPAAVVLAVAAGKNGGIRVGLADGRIVLLDGVSAAVRKALKLYDVIFVQLQSGSGLGARVELRTPPSVQGAALVLENRTGRILAMTGGFSYPLSQLNRVAQSKRQPGSTLKPITYLAALQAGLQPNTLVRDEPITLAPIGDSANAREADYWSPNRQDSGSGILTLRRALEGSKNLATAHLLDGGITSNAEDSLERVCELAMEAKLYGECIRYYPFVLGAQPLRLIDLAAFYAAIANEGARPSPHSIDSILEDGRPVYRNDASAVSIGSADRATFFQLKSMLQGVVERGTARAMRELAAYVAGKTGTTEEENDAWFVGFTNDVTVAVWVGYDNADGHRRTLGQRETGAKVALPIFEAIIQAVWRNYAPRSVLSPPSPEARRQLVQLPIDLNTGDRLATASPRAFLEYFRLDRHGELDDTQHRLVDREEVLARREEQLQGAHAPPFEYDDNPRIAPFWRAPPQLPRWGEGYSSPFWWDNQERPRPRRIDPDYFWGYRRF